MHSISDWITRSLWSMLSNWSTRIRQICGQDESDRFEETSFILNFNIMSSVVEGSLDHRRTKSNLQIRWFNLVYLVSGRAQPAESGQEGGSSPSAWGQCAPGYGDAAGSHSLFAPPTLPAQSPHPQSPGHAHTDQTFVNKCLPWRQDQRTWIRSGIDISNKESEHEWPRPLHQHNISSITTNAMADQQLYD